MIRRVKEKRHSDRYKYLDASFKFFKDRYPEVIENYEEGSGKFIPSLEALQLVIDDMRWLVKKNEVKGRRWSRPRDKSGLPKGVL